MMDEQGKELWRTVLAHDILIPPTEDESKALRHRMSEMTTRLVLWQGSDGTIEMPTIGEVCELAADIARFNVRVHLADLGDNDWVLPINPVKLP